MGFGNLFQNEAHKNNLEELYGENISLLHDIRVDKQVNPSLPLLIEYYNPEHYGSCMSKSLLFYIRFLILSSSSQLKLILGKGGREYSASYLKDRFLNVQKNPKLNFKALGVGFGQDINPVINLKFVYYPSTEGEDLILVYLDFLYEQISEYYEDEEGNEVFNETLEAKNFTKAVESSQLLLPLSFQFHPSCVLVNGKLDPYKWGGFAYVSTLPQTFIDYVKTCSNT